MYLYYISDNSALQHGTLLCAVNSQLYIPIISPATDFDLDNEADKIGFMIKRIKVHTGQALKDPGYRFPGNYGVEKFLELFSEEDYDAFCLAYMFTYR